MRSRLLARMLIAPLPLMSFVGLAHAECLAVNEAASACRYSQGDAWCRENFDDGRVYAYRNRCLSSGEVSSSQGVEPPRATPQTSATSQAVAPVEIKSPEQLKQEQIQRLRAKVRSDQQQAQAQQEAQQRAYAEQRAQQASQAQAASQPPPDPCSHLYIGKSFDAPGGFFKIEQRYVVLGFSSSSGQATITSLPDDGVWRQEVSCSQIP